jgi:hypothetical protein
MTMTDLLELRLCDVDIITGKILDPEPNSINDLWNKSLIDENDIYATYK